MHYEYRYMNKNKYAYVLLLIKVLQFHMLIHAFLYFYFMYYACIFERFPSLVMFLSMSCVIFTILCYHILQIPIHNFHWKWNTFLNSQSVWKGFPVFTRTRCERNAGKKDAKKMMGRRLLQNYVKKMKEDCGDNAGPQPGHTSIKKLFKCFEMDIIIMSSVNKTDVITLTIEASNPQWIFETAWSSDKEAVYKKTWYKLLLDYVIYRYNSVSSRCFKTL